MEQPTEIIFKVSVWEIWKEIAQKKLKKKEFLFAPSVTNSQNISQKVDNEISTEIESLIIEFRKHHPWYITKMNNEWGSKGLFIYFPIFFCVVWDSLCYYTFRGNPFEFYLPNELNICFLFKKSKTQFPNTSRCVSPFILSE